MRPSRPLRLLSLVALLAVWAAGTFGSLPFAQTTRMVIPGGTALPATCNVREVFFKTTATIGLYACNVANTWTLIGASAGSAAPADATYITQTADSALTNEQAIGTLSSGILRGAATTGVVTSLGDVLPVANGGTGVTDGAAVRLATVTLTDAQIKALPTTPITLVAAPGAGFFLQPLRAVLICDASGGVYTNINANAYLNLRRNDWSVDSFAYLVNGNGGGLIDTTLTDVTDFLAAVSKNLWVPLPYANGQESGVGAGIAWENGWGPMANHSTTSTIYDVTDAENEAIVISAENQGSGNFTGGHAANTLTVRIYYTIEAIP